MQKTITSYDMVTSLDRPIGGFRFFVPTAKLAPRCYLYTWDVEQNQTFWILDSFIIWWFLNIIPGIAITINKAQGQTFQCVGIDLRFNYFSHGQLYIGLSRTGNSENQFLFLPQYGLQIKNVVYSEILWEQYFKM